MLSITVLYLLAILPPTSASPTPLPLAPSTWTHPGIFLGKAQLEFIKSRVTSRLEPWFTAYNSMLNHPLANLSRLPSPRETVECGSYSTPNNGCTDERSDALAAYAMSLAWYTTSNQTYYSKALSYLNAWPPVLKSHNNTNAPLQAGWAASSWTRAAEIIRHSSSNWPAADISAFENMLSTIYLPITIPGSQSNGNWELVMLESALSIAVFTEDGTAYEKALTQLLSRVPAYIYLTSDGELPRTAVGSKLTTPEQVVKYWQGQRVFENGTAQETCRDFTHTGYGIASTGHFAETVRLQGTDLYATTDLGDRLRYALEFHAKYELQLEPVPADLCNGTLNLGLGPVTEVGLNALHGRAGYDMHNTQALTEKQRPEGTNSLFVGWETLTHAGNTA